ncbi:flavin reductase family protein [Aquibacillus sp. 3ASR75-11]|uniref:Flavin reductase family protein n=1 Tax=Terrihalobacillus insolitus TaxID=2950438 RepID=A0A9X3WXB7_9BACI|nr:flavin reductase family protein [Terrihalobacillus insolitus]MDC3415045.1 flavin reductase family protein [Terrihalobacillus insolitus]MDC3425901.1 flavin reductase family protein [Terrihalobacillus insolitus]
MDDRLFRDAMGRFATGITIVTAEYEEEVHGMTVNAFMSISLEPKLIAISIDENASMYDKLQETKQFGLSILSEQQKDISMIYAKQKEKDREITFIKRNNIPVLPHSLASFTCHVTDTYKAGDHMIFIAEVQDLELGEQNEDPILYYSGKYHNLQTD